MILLLISLAQVGESNVSSSTPTVSSGASGDVQRSDGSGGFTGDSNLNFEHVVLQVH